MSKTTENKIANNKLLEFFKKHKKLFIVLGIIVALCGILELIYQYRISVVRNEVLRVEKTIVQPAGGRNYTELSIRCPHYIDSVGWVDINCPTASQSWYVAVDKDVSLGSYIAEVLKEMGYTNHDNITDFEGRGEVVVYTGKLAVNVGAYKVNASDEPYKLPESKKWVRFSVSVYESSYKVGQK